MARSKGWTCQRTLLGIKCKKKNPPRSRKCQKCGKPRPPRKRPSHLAALDLTYEDYIVINGGVEQCAICGRAPNGIRKLDRDHEHKGEGRARGLLCNPCNRKLRHTLTSDWLRAAADYLDR